MNLFMPVGLRKGKRHKKKKIVTSEGGISSTLEFKLILTCLWQLENKLNDGKEIKTLHEENWMLPSPKSRIRNQRSQP